MVFIFYQRVTPGKVVTRWRLGSTRPDRRYRNERSLSSRNDHVNRDEFFKRRALFKWILKITWGRIFFFPFHSQVWNWAEWKSNFPTGWQIWWSQFHHKTILYSSSDLTQSMNLEERQTNVPIDKELIRNLSSRLLFIYRRKWMDMSSIPVGAQKLQISNSSFPCQRFSPISIRGIFSLLLPLKSCTFSYTQRRLIQLRIKSWRIYIFVTPGKKYLCRVCDVTTRSRFFGRLVY